MIMLVTSHARHGVSSHRQADCLFKWLAHNKEMKFRNTGTLWRTWWSVVSSYKGPVMRKIFPRYEVITIRRNLNIPPCDPWLIPTITIEQTTYFGENIGLTHCDWLWDCGYMSASNQVMVCRPKVSNNRLIQFWLILTNIPAIDPLYFHKYSIYC